LLPSGERRPLIDGATYPIYAGTGHLIFMRDGVILAASFDAATSRVTGPPVRLIDNVAISSLVGMPLASVSHSGALLFAPNNAGTSRLVWRMRNGAEQPLNSTPRLYRNPRLFPDQRRVVAEAGSHLWLHDIDRGSFTRVTSAATGGNSFPVLTRDGSRIVFRTLTGMKWMSTNGSDTAEPIAGSTHITDIPSAISPDGRILAFVRQGPATTGDVYVVPLDGSGPPRPIVNGAAYEGGPQFAPSGRWLAFTSDESGRSEVYVRPYPGPDRRWQVSTDGGNYPRWADNNELFYRSGNRMMVVNVSGTSELTLSPPSIVFEDRYSFAGAQSVANYDVTPDGRRFVMSKEESDSGRLNLILNWFEDLRRLAPVE
jgi:serine/threonine-protein kinase